MMRVVFFKWKTNVDIRVGVWLKNNKKNDNSFINGIISKQYVQHITEKEKRKKKEEKKK